MAAWARRAITLALLFSIGACAGQSAASPAVTPMPLPTTPLATASIPEPPGLGGGLPQALPEAAPAAVASPATSPLPNAQPDLNYVSDGWPHGQASSICGVTDQAISTSMWTWPPFDHGTTIIGGAGGSTTYVAEFLMYKGWLGWHDNATNQNRYAEGPWLGGFGNLAGLSDRTWVFLNGKWWQTGAITNDVAPYYGNDSKVRRPSNGTFWTWVQYYWWPVYEGTPEHPGRMVFAGKDHLDYVGISEAACG